MTPRSRSGIYLTVLYVVSFAVFSAIFATLGWDRFIEPLALVIFTIRLAVYLIFKI